MTARTTPIEIINARFDDRGEYLGRRVPGRRGSPLANPFVIGKDGNREQVIALYGQWLHGKIASGDVDVICELDRLTEIARGGRLTLRCWCAPLPCHAEIIRSVIQERL